MNSGNNFEQQDSGEEGATLVDFSGVDENQTQPQIPRGVHAAVIEEMTFGNSQSSGNPMWTVKFEITEEGEFKGSTLYFFLPFTPKMLPRIKKFLITIGQRELANSKFDPAAVADSGSFVGIPVRLRTDLRKYEDQMRANVRDVLPAGEGQQGAGDSFL